MSVKVNNHKKLVDILKEIGRLSKQPKDKDTNRELDNLNREFDLACKRLMRENTVAEKCVDE